MKYFSASTHRAWQSGAVSAAAPLSRGGSYMEHRWGVRRACRARVNVTTSAGSTGAARMRDISISGAFIETTLPVPLFSQIEVAMLNDDGSANLIEFAATVVRTAPDGIGIEWCDSVSGSICDLVGCGRECGRAGG